MTLVKRIVSLENEVDNMADTDGEILREIINFVRDEKGYSYYDLKRYAYENDKIEWISVLRNKNSRCFIAGYLRDKRCSDGVPYNNFFGLPRE